MSQAARALAWADDGGRHAANDNEPGAGDTESDRWRWLIERLKSIHMPSAVIAATCKLEGMTVDEFARHMRLAMKRCGWPQAQEFEG
jgi:hypothetical protein